MREDLAAAEQAVFDAMTQDAPMRIADALDLDDWEYVARAVVAAVRPIGEAEMLDEIAMLIGNEPTPLVQRGSIVTRLRTRAANRRLAAERQAEGDDRD